MVLCAGNTAFVAAQWSDTPVDIEPAVSELPPSLKKTAVKGGESTPKPQNDTLFSRYFVDQRNAEGFHICANFSLNGVDSILGEIERLERDLKNFLALPRRNELIEIFLFESEASYLNFLKNEFPTAPCDRRALFIKQKGMSGIVIMQLTKEIDDDIRHEMTHALLHACYSDIPLWLDEGLAEYFELSPEKRANEKPYIKKAMNNFIFVKTAPSIKRLENIQEIFAFGIKEYQESWAWVHFLIHRSSKTHQLLAGYLATVGSGKSVDSFEKYLSRTVPDYKSQYVDHFKNWKDFQISVSKENIIR
ncbi:MAG: DUF1570 domain-containing protein [Planctomycetaceae bacterium]|nr:DUF1570 domain-containing protein [Planctomycetaceae bacterium]